MLHAGLQLGAQISQVTIEISALHVIRDCALKNSSADQVAGKLHLYNLFLETPRHKPTDAVAWRHLHFFTNATNRLFDSGPEIPASHVKGYCHVAAILLAVRSFNGEPGESGLSIPVT